MVDESQEREQRRFLQRTDVKHDLRARIFPRQRLQFDKNLAGSSALFSGGFKTHKWTSSLTLNYFLWRDRKGAISNFVSFLAMLVMLQLLLLLAYESLWQCLAFPFYF